MPELITKTQVREEYGLTEALLRRLGEPDALRPNPHYRSAAPMQLYRRDRVAAWVEENAALLESRQSARAAAARASATKRERARAEVAALVAELRMDPTPSRAKLRADAQSFLWGRYGHRGYDGEVTDRALCSHIRHRYTNYESILSVVKGKVGAGDLYAAVKLLLCCHIIARYGLEVCPEEAAGFDVEGEDPEAWARGVLGLKRGEGVVV